MIEMEGQRVRGQEEIERERKLAVNTVACVGYENNWILCNINGKF